MAENKPVRVRMAPSPTGDPHIGTAYLSLFNYAFAKSQGGTFILRIEDTDQVRSTRESEAAIFEALHWVGLAWDEGPDVGGPCGPYRQSERTEIYREHCRQLVAKGHAYPCFCTAERLAEVRREQEAAKLPLGYDGHCAALAPEEAKARMEAGETHVIRMRVPAEGECVLNDRLRGEIRIPWDQVDQQVLLKSDGFPTYHLANVVDDHLMGITHVIRGEEWINSAPKHLLLYGNFGWEPPQMIHMPLLRNPDKSKLSKRKNPTSILYYRQAGYLPEAVLNYLGLMGYAMSDEREMFGLEEFVADFNIDRISLGGPIFDMQKLSWLNGRYLREQLAPEGVLERLKGWMLNDELMKKVIPLAQPRIEKLTDFIPMTAFLFADRIAYDAALLTSKALDGGRVAEMLKVAQWEMEKLRAWQTEILQERFKTIAEREGVSMRDLTAPFYVAMSGSPSSLPLFQVMEILGSDMTRRRLQYALEALAAAGFDLKGKRLKQLESRYAEQYTL